MIDSEERDERVMTMAEEALKMPLGERESFLQSECQNDPDLYRDISSVVSWEERMSGFLERPLIEFIDLELVEEVFKPGQTVSGRFEIVRCVGDGGMGIVYEAFDNKRRQRIAIKVAKPGFGRLLSPELEGALKVRHPNICLVNEIHATSTEFGDLDFLTMEFLEGETLAHKLEQGKLEEAEALEIARQLCAGVAAAHRSGVLHRDLKPGNVILCRQKDGSTRAVVTDFGLATEGTSEVEGGTPSYMAPELQQNEKASPASDVFSLGVILYEMVTGQKPFPASTGGHESFYPPVAPARLVKSLPHRWDKAILPGLSPDPQSRCSAEEMLGVLDHKPFYRRLAPVVAIAACLVAAVLGAPRIIGTLTPPPIRLAVLPVDAPVSLAQRGRSVLDDAAKRVTEIQVGKATTSVIPLSKAMNKGVATPQEAGSVLGATHALQLQLHAEAAGLVAKGAIIDLRTMAHVQDYSGHFAEADLADLSTGLTGFTSWALHLHRKSQPETVVSAAAVAYKNGQENLERDLDRTPPDFSDAIYEFQEAARLNPHSPLPLAGLAEAHIREHQFKNDEAAGKDAQLWLARAEALNPDSPTVRRVSGLVHTIQGDYPKALEDYLRVEEIEPGNVEAWLGSGYAYAAQGMPNNAVKDYTQAISIAPNYYKPYKYLGALHFYYGRYDQAEAMYKKFIEWAPGREEGYASLAGIYITEAKYGEAEKVYEASLQRNETAIMLNNIGAMLAYQGRQREAMHFYQRAVAKDRSVPFYWLNLGDTQRRLYDQVKARASYQHGLQVTLGQITANTASPLTRAHFAYLQARLGFKDRARSEIAAALNSPAVNDQVFLGAVCTYEVLGDRERSLAAAAMATIQTRKEMDHHPDLAGLQGDSRFRALINETK